MRDINLKHLHYFWAVAHEGSIAAASERLFVTPQTISAQLKQLEASIGIPLFQRRGTGLTLTRSGETALDYADAIFDLRKEMTAALLSEQQGGGQVRVGIADVVPKLIATLVLRPLTCQEPPKRLICRESDQETLLGLLGRQKLDFVLSDHPAPPDPNLRLYNHELGETGISFMAAPGVIPEGSEAFPECLAGRPLLLPGKRTALRMTLENWLLQQEIEVRVAGEFDDSALIKAFGQTGAGVFTCPTAIEHEVGRQYSVKLVGRTTALRERFYLVSTTRHIEESGFRDIVERARGEIFR